MWGSELCPRCTLSLDPHSPGSGMGPGCFQLQFGTPLFPSPCSTPARTRCWSLGRLAGSSMSHAQGCPRLCPRSGGSGATGVTEGHGQQGWLLQLPPQRAPQAHGGCGWVCPGGQGCACPWALPGLCLFSPARDSGPAGRSQHKFKECCRLFCHVPEHSVCQDTREENQPHLQVLLEADPHPHPSLWDRSHWG